VARYEPGLKTQARIIDAARDLLGEVGLDGTTVKAICDRAGVRAGSFYNLFESKEQVILTVVRDAIAAVDPHPAHDVPDTVDELIEAYVRFITDQSPLARIYLQIAISGALTDGELATAVVRHHRRRVERFGAAMRLEQPEISDHEIELRTQVLLAALQGLAFDWLMDPKFDFATHARRVAEVRHLAEGA
jgi:AcrR family transcriptional regulator